MAFTALDHVHFTLVSSMWSSKKSTCIEPEAIAEKNKAIQKSHVHTLNSNPFTK